MVYKLWLYYTRPTVYRTYSSPYRVHNFDTGDRDTIITSAWVIGECGNILQVSFALLHELLAVNYGNEVARFYIGRPGEECVVVSCYFDSLGLVGLGRSVWRCPVTLTVLVSSFEIVFFQYHVYLTLLLLLLLLDFMS